MNKKSAITVAGAILGLVVAATSAVALNLGILSRTATPASAALVEVEPQPATPTSVPTKTDLNIFPDDTRVITVYVDEPAAPAEPGASGPAPQQPAPGASAPTKPPPKPTTPPATAQPVPTAEPTQAPATVTYPIYDAGPAGQVALAFNGDSILFWGAYPNVGWQYAVENDGPSKVKVKFRRGGDDDDEQEEEGEVEFQAELEGSKIKVEVGG